MRCNTLKFLFCLAAVVALLVGIGAIWAQEEHDPAAVPPEIPADAKAMKNPREATPQSIANGKQIYTSQCEMCHGATGDGKGALASRFKYSMPDFTSAEVQTNWTDGALFYVLTNGHGKMTGEGERLEAETRWDLVNYVRALGKS
jgi:mono/diheme cytochrome c family protein